MCFPNMTQSGAAQPLFGGAVNPNGWHPYRRDGAIEQGNPNGAFANTSWNTIAPGVKTVPYGTPDTAPSGGKASMGNFSPIVGGAKGPLGKAIFG